MMSKFILTIGIALINALLFSQVDYSTLSIDYGKNNVAFNDTTLVDPTRSYHSQSHLTSSDSRPIHISIWSPTTDIKKKDVVKVVDYLKVMMKEQEWPNLPFSYFFDWFNIRGTKINKTNSKFETHAVQSNDYLDSNKPVVIYSASYEAPSVENFILAEYLASHGYTFIAVPSRGTNSLSLEAGNINDAYAQSRDVDYVIQNLSNLGIDEGRDIYLSGFSFGGMSHIINALKGNNIKGVISLDGTIKYVPELLEKSFEYDVKNFNIPFIHFSQKDIPISILKRENSDTLINDNFEFYDSSNAIIKYQFKSKVLRHDYFSSFGLLFKELNKEQDSNYENISNGHKELMALSLYFLNTLDKYYLTNDWNHQEIISNVDTNEFTLIDYGINIDEPDDTYYLIGLNEENGYAKLKASYDHLISEGKEINISEGALNTAGLQLIFSDSTYTKGVNIFKFALSLFPESANLYDSLAEGHFNKGDMILALLNFEKSLQLYPGNLNAVNRIEEINNK